MSDSCVACGEVAEGKPLYKKLGSGDCQTEVFTALHELQLISLPLKDKNTRYICWDCDETIAEEYMTFIAAEAKKKVYDEKRKRQDEARNFKVQQKLKRAFKKVHEDKLKAKGVPTPASQKKLKDKKREENKYYASHCILCKSSFEEDKGRGFQRFTLHKMVDDEKDVAQVLKKLKYPIDHSLSGEDKRKRHICCQCYNKMRRTYKSISKGENTLNKSDTFLQSPMMGLPDKNPQDILKSKRRPTAEEHAAEIAKLIPPALADLYKVVTKDDAPVNRSRKERKLSSSSSSNSDDNDSDSSSSSNSSSNSSEDEVDEDEWKPTPEKNDKGVPKASSIKTILPSVKQTNHDDATIGTKSLIDFEICNLCGLGYKLRPKDFWYFLHSFLPGIDGVSVDDALHIMETKLGDVEEDIRKKGYICKPCFLKIGSGFRTRILEKIAHKKGMSLSQLKSLSLKVDVYEDGSGPNNTKVNGSTPSNHIVEDVSKKSKSSTSGRSSSHKSKKKKSHHHKKSKKSSNHSKPKSSSSSWHERDSKLTQKTIASDLNLLHEINQRKHFTFKGKAMKLFNVSVHVANLKRLLPSSAYRRASVRLELLKDCYKFSNVYRNIKCKSSWSTCIICQKKRLGLKETTRWLDDPVAPPNIMVPIRWAQLSIGVQNSKVNFATEEGKVCSDCHRYLKVKFGQFVGAKVAASHKVSSVESVLSKYKVSFDSTVMNIVADPLEKEIIVKEKKTSKHEKTPCNTNSDSDFNKKPIECTESVTKSNNAPLFSDKLSQDLALSDSSEDELDVNTDSKSVATSNCNETANHIPLVSEEDNIDSQTTENNNILKVDPTKGNHLLANESKSDTGIEEDTKLRKSEVIMKPLNTEALNNPEIKSMSCPENKLKLSESTKCSNEKTPNVLSSKQNESPIESSLSCEANVTEIKNKETAKEDILNDLSTKKSIPEAESLPRKQITPDRSEPSVINSETPTEKPLSPKVLSSATKASSSTTAEAHSPRPEATSSSTAEAHSPRPEATSPMTDEAHSPRPEATSPMTDEAHSPRPEATSSSTAEAHSPRPKATSPMTDEAHSPRPEATSPMTDEAHSPRPEATSLTTTEAHSLTTAEAHSPRPEATSSTTAEAHSPRPEATSSTPEENPTTNKETLGTSKKVSLNDHEQTSLGTEKNTLKMSSTTKREEKKLQDSIFNSKNVSESKSCTEISASMTQEKGLVNEKVMVEENELCLESINSLSTFEKAASTPSLPSSSTHQQDKLLASAKKSTTTLELCNKDENISHKNSASTLERKKLSEDKTLSSSKDKNESFEEEDVPNDRSESISDVDVTGSFEDSELSDGGLSLSVEDRNSKSSSHKDKSYSNINNSIVNQPKENLDSDKLISSSDESSNKFKLKNRRNKRSKKGNYIVKNLKDNKKASPTTTECDKLNNSEQLVESEPKKRSKGTKLHEAPFVKEAEMTSTTNISQRVVVSPNLIPASKDKNKKKVLIEERNDNGLKKYNKSLKRVLSVDESSLKSSKMPKLMAESPSLFQDGPTVDFSNCQLADHPNEDYGEDSVAPFVQRKKRRAVSTEEQDTENNSVGGSSEVKSTVLENVWQGIQGISLDDLLTKNIQQCLRLSQFNVGFMLALNDLRSHIGASVEDLVGWIRNLLPMELREKGYQPSVEKFSSFLFSLNKTKEDLDLKKLSEPLAEELFIQTTSQSKERSVDCFIEDMMSRNYNSKGRLVWDDFLAPVNLDNLFKGKECRVSWNEFNNGLLYALWRVNKMFKGDSDNFKKWLTLTSTTLMKDSDYSAMCNAAEAIHKHISKFPEEINRLVAPIVIKRNEKSKLQSAVKETPAKKGTPVTNKKDTPLDGGCRQKPVNSITDSLNNQNTSNQAPRKRPPTVIDLEAMPVKKTARVQPQPSVSVNPTSKSKISQPRVRVKDLKSLTGKSTSPHSKVSESSSNVIQEDASLPVITSVVGRATKSFNQNYSSQIMNVNQEVQPLYSNSPFAFAQTPITCSISNSPVMNQYFNKTPFMPSSVRNQAGVPLIPMLSPNGFMTMVPLRMSNTTAPTSVQESASIKFQGYGPIESSRLPEDTPSTGKDSELASKVSDLERKLAEIEQQNNRLKQINKRLSSQNLKGDAAPSTSSAPPPPSTSSVPPPPSTSSVPPPPSTSSAPAPSRKIMPKKSKTTFEDALNYDYKKK